MLPTIRVLVVDDSALVRQMLSRALAMDPRIEVVGSAKDGVEAIEKAAALDPDVITLDVDMPELSGLEALRRIRKRSRARVVMLSSLDDPDTTYRALALGAVDFMAKPSVGVASSLTELTDALLKTIKTAYRVVPERTSSLPDPLSTEGADTDQDVRAPVDERLAACVAIAASTGGPPALERVFAKLKATLPAAYVVVQHLPPGFSESLARRLDTLGSVRVRLARDGEVLEPGEAYFAPHGMHMVVEARSGSAVLRLLEGAPLHGVRPAADPLFESVARSFRQRSVGVVLTGMGSDGARGALSIKQAGGDVIVQDEESSIVWGMPGAALRAGVTNRTVPLSMVVPEIQRAVRARALGVR